MAFEAIDHLLEPEAPKPKFGSGVVDHLLEDDSTPINEIPANRTIGGTLGDLGVSALKGAVELPQAVVGLADIPTGGRVGNALESVGYKPKQALETLDTLYSPAQQYANKQVQNADGFLPTLGAIAKYPSVIPTTAIESLPSMGGGGIIAKGAMKALPAILPKLSTTAARISSGAIGEAAISAGATEEQIRGQTDNGLTTPEQSGLAALSGAGTGLISGVSGKIANKLGIADIDTIAVGGTGRAANQGVLSSIGKGAISEGLLEEAPQSAQEQALQNVALNKPISEGVGNAAAIGAVTGGVIGGAVGPLSRAANQSKPPSIDASNIPRPTNEPPPLGLGTKPNWGDDEIIDYPDGSRGTATDLYSQYLAQTNDPEKAKKFVDDTIKNTKNARSTANSTNVSNGALGPAGMGVGKQPPTQQPADNSAEDQATNAANTGGLREQPDTGVEEYKPKFDADEYTFGNGKTRKSIDTYNNLLIAHNGDAKAAEAQTNFIINTVNKENKNALRTTGVQRQDDTEPTGTGEGIGNTGAVPGREEQGRDTILPGGGTGGNVPRPAGEPSANVDNRLGGDTLEPEKQTNEFKPTHKLNDGYGTPVIKTEDGYVDSNGELSALDSEVLPIKQPIKEVQRETTKTTDETNAKTETQEVPAYDAGTDKLRVQILGTEGKLIKLKRVQRKDANGQWVNMDANSKPFNIPIAEFNKKYAKPANSQENKKIPPDARFAQGDTKSALDAWASQTPPIQDQEQRQEGTQVTDALKPQPENVSTGGIGGVLPNTVQAQEAAPDVEGKVSGNAGKANGLNKNQVETSQSNAAGTSQVEQPTNVETLPKQQIDQARYAGMQSVSDGGSSVKGKAKTLATKQFIKQKANITRLKNVAKNSPTLNEKAVAQKKIKDAESDLRKMRLSAFDIDNAIDLAIDGNDASGIEKLKDLFPDTAKFVRQHLSSEVNPSPTNTVASQDSDNINSKIDEETSKAATSPLNDIPQPTDAQKEAGNYKKAHINLQGLNITIENPKGSKRSGKDSDGKPWSVEMKSHYGYIKRTTGADDEQVDVFIGPDPTSEEVYVVNQIDPKTGKFDEHKVMLGFKSKGAAKVGYNRNYAKGWKGLESITEMSMDEFKKELASGKLDKPLKNPSEPIQDNATKNETVTPKFKKGNSYVVQDDEKTLIDHGVLKQHHLGRDNWFYKIQPDGGWFTANSKADAMEMAQKTFDLIPEKERQTVQQKSDNKDEEIYAQMDKRYGKKSIQELKQEVEKLSGDISKLQKAGENEFNGMGSRRTKKATSNEAARGAGEEKLKLKSYILSREEKENNSIQHNGMFTNNEQAKNVNTESMTPEVKQAKPEKQSYTPPEKLVKFFESAPKNSGKLKSGALDGMENAERIQYVQDNFLDIILQLNDNKAIEVNGKC